MWLIYALGGGWGHVTRATALASIAQRERPVRILTNSPYAAIIARALPTLDFLQLDPSAPAEATRCAVRREVAACRASCLIVDTFPRGIGGELADVLGTLDARKVLVHRDLSPRYVKTADIRTFVADHYDLVIVPGAGEGSQLGDLKIACETDPWLVRSPDQIPDRVAVRSILRLERHEESCVLVCASGKKDELEWYAAAASAIRQLDRNVPVRMVSAGGSGIKYWPAMDLFGSADVVVGGAGYNTVRECLAWGVPMVARPWPRTYDRQERRAIGAAACGEVSLVKTPDEAACAALNWMAEGSPGLPRFVNGAVEAVCRVAQTLRSH